MTDITILGLYPFKATRVRNQATSLTKAGYEVVVRGPPIMNVPTRILSLFFRYLSLFVLTFVAPGRVVHYSNIPDFSAIGFIFRRGKVVYDVRTPFAVNMYYHTRSMVVWKLCIGIERLIYRRATVTLAANRYLAERARRLGAKKVVVVPNYPVPSLKSTVGAEEFKEQQNLSSTTPVFTIVSYLTKVKPFETLFEQFMVVLGKYPDARLWVIGDGPDSERLQSIASKLSPNIEFKGFQTYSTLGNYINASDVCVAIYEKKVHDIERFYSVESVWKVGEYALFDKPIVALNMVPDNGLFLATEENLGEKLIEAYENPEKRLEKKTWEDSEKILLDVYQELLQT